MARKQYTIGIDFGTLSGRAVLVDVSDGSELATAVSDYNHGVIDKYLPGSKIPLPSEWALQDPQDYLTVLHQTIPAVIAGAEIDPADVVGIGIDFTACTMLPTMVDGTPLCFTDEFRGNPHSWVKLWKHHAAQPQADQINQAARLMGESWLDCYGGSISSEWFFSKALQLLQEAPEIYRAADRLIEAGDWIVWQLSGEETRGACAAGYKAMVQESRYPSRDFFAALHPDFADIIETKMLSKFVPLGARAGGLQETIAAELGLQPGLAVAAASIDAHATAPAVRATRPGQMVMIMGTSNCHMLISDRQTKVDGMSGVVDGGIVPGLYGYESGQSGVGDIFAWFVANGVPQECFQAAAAAGMSLHEYLENEAAKQAAGAHGLIALDWWNGNRSTLDDASLSGLLIGMTLATGAADIYRALIEATAFGTRVIVDAYESSGLPVAELICAGSLPEKNGLLRQIYADVTGRSFKLAGTGQASALGSAIHAAVAAGVYDTIHHAAEKMGKCQETVIEPIPENQAVYDALYAEYKLLYDYFGRGTNDVMKRLKQIRHNALIDQ